MNSIKRRQWRGLVSSLFSQSHCYFDTVSARHLFSSSKMPSSPLYGLDELGPDPKNRFPEWSREVWRDCEARLNAAIVPSNHQSNHSVTDVAVVIDRVSEDLCLVLDSASCCASTHGDGETRAIAERTFLELYEKVQTINLNPRLYEALRKSHERRGRKSPCNNDNDDDNEIDRMSSKLLEEFEWEGAGLPLSRREKVGVLQNRLRSLSSELQTEAMLLDSKRRPIRLSNGNDMEIPNTEENFQQLLAHPQLDSSDKQSIYNQRFALDDTLSRFAQRRSQLRYLRSEVSSLLGFDSFARFQVRKNMAHSPEEVREFLIRVAEQVRPIVDRLISSNGNGKMVFEWELPSHPKLASKHQRVSKRIDSMFTIKRCLNGLERVARDVFGVEAHLLAIPSNNSQGNNSWGSSTPCFEMHFPHASQSPGVLYLDLFAREGKSPGAALYQIRTRRRGSSPSSSAIALLSCSFPLTRPSEPLEVVVGHAGFRTLMHEFGHALHAVLSETRYQHLSGTRCEMDFMETPSLLLERLSWDPRVTRVVDEKSVFLGEDDLKSIERNRLEGGFSALDVQEQVLCALFDLEACGSHNILRGENELFWDVRSKYGSLRVPQNWNKIHRELYFFHPLGAYAGSFYSYPWSNAIVSLIYERLFGRGSSLGEGAGLVFRDALLRTGGSRDPWDVFNELTGGARDRRQVSEDAMIRDLTA